jgi:glycine cleavage system protein P-like pyridoxal-binding family
MKTLKITNEIMSKEDEEDGSRLQEENKNDSRELEESFSKRSLLSNEYPEDLRYQRTVSSGASLPEHQPNPYTSCTMKYGSRDFEQFKALIETVQAPFIQAIRDRDRKN